MAGNCAALAAPRCRSPTLSRTGSRLSNCLDGHSCLSTAAGEVSLPARQEDLLKLRYLTILGGWELAGWDSSILKGTQAVCCQKRLVMHCTVTVASPANIVTVLLFPAPGGVISSPVPVAG